MKKSLWMRFAAKQKKLRREASARVSAYRNLQEVFIQSERSFQAGPYFEEIDPTIAHGREALAKVIAFYLPQFHELEINNQHWGNGFTEWTNIPRHIPRFPGHIAPRVPRDLGYYNLTQGDIQHRQAQMAKQSGVYGFCYYYYRFDGTGFMDAPLERMLSDPSLDFPFCLMWCNETWTRAWEGNERSIIAEQKYSDDLDIDLVDDISRCMADSRYIRLENRPLLVVYRPSFLDSPRYRLNHIRDLFKDRHGLDPILVMAQTDASTDPAPFELDGAVEFVANKYNGKLRPAMPRSAFFDPTYVKDVSDYDDLVAQSLGEAPPSFQFARSVMPHWDNNPRKPGRGSVIHGSTPYKFQEWTGKIIASAREKPFFSEPVVFVSAWNEWAESAYLEPDTHFGSAYLNALSRAVHGY